MKFSIKDLGALHYFLGTEVISTPVGFFLTWHKYILDLFTKNNLCEAKEVIIPITLSPPLTENDMNLFPLMQPITKVFLVHYNIYP